MLDALAGSRITVRADLTGELELAELLHAIRLTERPDNHRRLLAARPIEVRAVKGHHRRLAISSA